jgi:CRISPR-associated protein Cas2
MYVILVYDIGEKRVAKMLKLCRRYFELDSKLCI